MTHLESIEPIFVKDVADHEVKCVGSFVVDKIRYGTWRCGTDSLIYHHFNVSTWPGYLAISGGMGEFMWSRNANMLAFVRGSMRSVDYFHEKLCAGNSREYNPKNVRQWLVDERRGAEVEDEETRNCLLEQLTDIEDGWGGDDGSEDSFYRAVSESDSYHDGLSEGLDVRSYTYRYLWCCLALEWFAARIDELTSLASKS